ncbi:gamma-glutamyl-gamma-aminobutyrate hydrolase family protein [Isobaculum melis]|uniref:Putative glutamine amidotransferase n=1 Tax=Isobaculum melis TaxID=142588 RepID=A0A1H9Q1Q6_9LACT|nr:gamma-glutamyl-gamma-aminobutyrate hydrolase family protein [Isobaculum melis]SER53889.1 putative glutamine amidotransferase [Isobaculum melis]
MKIKIGITGNILTDSIPTFHGQKISYTPHQFVLDLQEIEHVLPIVIPVSKPQAVKHYVELIDALLVTGGQDISPALYGEKPDEKLGKVSLERDLSEQALIEEALKQGKPILAVCRGMQLLNVVAGGTLYQDLSQHQPHTVIHEPKDDVDIPTHPVSIAPDSALAEILGTKHVVNSLHHQGIKTLAPNFRPVAWAEDELIEAYESMEQPNIIAVQWHPELAWQDDVMMKAIFQGFVNLVKK